MTRITTITDYYDVYVGDIFIHRYHDTLALQDMLAKAEKLVPVERYPNVSTYVYDRDGNLLLHYSAIVK